MTFLINQAIFVLINLIMAKSDANKIKKQKPVNHLQNGLLYISLMLVFVIIFGMDLLNIIVFTVTCFCNRQLFFDIPLNLMRKLPWDYVSEKPESFVDKIEVSLFGQKGDTPNIIYGMMFIASIIINLTIL